MKIIYNRIARFHKKKMPLFFKIINALLVPFFLLISTILCMRGAMVHFYLILISIYLFLLKKISLKHFFQMVVYPFDSVRYYEAHVFFKILKNNVFKFKNYLDISSPRIFPFTFCFKKNKFIERCVLINPDNKDLADTRLLFQKSNMGCEFYDIKVDELPENKKFDFITCISVLEHIPGEGDIAAINKMWRILNNGGFLYVTVPCANEEIEEYFDVDPYGLNIKKSSEYYFFQRFYDKNMLKDRLFRITGQPVVMETFGERTPGRIHQRDTTKRKVNILTSTESLVTFLNIKKLKKFDELNAVGVVCMLFEKKQLKGMA